MRAAPLRDPLMPPVALQVNRRPDGTVTLASADPLRPYPANICTDVRRWSVDAPARPCLAERDGDGWHVLTYVEVVRHMDALSQALIDRGLGPQRPVMILSGNSIAHALLALAAQQVGIPVCPLTPTLAGGGPGPEARLAHAVSVVQPRLAFAEDGLAAAPALTALARTGAELVCIDRPPPGLPVTDFRSLLDTVPGPAVAPAVAAVTCDTVAKLLFTSGSTGQPKAVVTTHGMLSANQQSISQVLLQAEGEVPTYLDWLPWSHCYGGSYNFFRYLRSGGTLYIDNGRPLPGRFEETVRNLYEVAPSSYLNVPAGYTLLATEMERNEPLRRRFFGAVRRIGYGGAGLSTEIWQRFQDMAVATTGERLLFYAGWGATETSGSLSTLQRFHEGAGNIGTPLPGVTLKLVPVDDKYEVRVKSPVVFSAYHRQPGAAEACFDEEGFYRIGDTLRFVDPQEPAAGLRFHGRLAEDFKLQTGGWVTCGPLRLALIEACAPLLQDLVIAGEGRAELGILAWPNAAECRGLADLRGAVAERLRRWNESALGASTRIARFDLLDEPPSPEAGEISDKGYINQRRVLDRRAERVEALYAGPALRPLAART